MTAVSVEPGTRFHVSAKVALRTISSELPGSTCLPDWIMRLVELRLLGPAHRDEVGDDGFVAPVDHEAKVADDAALDGRDAGQLPQAIEDGARRALEVGEDVGEVRVGVEGVPRRLHRGRGGHRGDEARDAAADEQRDREALVPQAPEVADELAAERPHHETSLGALRSGFARSLAIRPSASVTTRSAICAMGALCVTTAMLVPSRG